MSDIIDDLLAGPQPPGRRACCTGSPVRDCTSCGQATCRQHLWTMLGICDTCAADERMARFQRPAVPEGRNWLEEA